VAALWNSLECKCGYADIRKDKGEVMGRGFVLCALISRGGGSPSLEAMRQNPGRARWVGVRGGVGVRGKGSHHVTLQCGLPELQNQAP